MKHVYLAGPIVGLTYEDAMGWRVRAAVELETAGIRSFNPLRGKKKWDGVDHLTNYHDGGHGLTPEQLVNRDLYDIRRSDVVLVNLLNLLNVPPTPIGTLIEIGYAHGLGKPLVVACPDSFALHPFLAVIPTYRTPYLATALARVKSLLEDQPNGTQ